MFSVLRPLSDASEPLPRTGPRPLAARSWTRRLLIAWLACTGTRRVRPLSALRAEPSVRLARKGRVVGAALLDGAASGLGAAGAVGADTGGAAAGGAASAGGEHSATV